MANIYGTKQHKEYIKEWGQFIADKLSNECKLTSSDTITKEYKNYFVQLDYLTYEYPCKGYIGSFSCSNLKIDKSGKQIYVCKNMYDDCNLLFFYNYNGQDYLLFRKALYGYCILNLETLEEYNYFPCSVLENKESFIITDAHIFSDILICEGCFWGGPYTCYLIDLKTYKTYPLWKEIYNLEESIKVEDNHVSIFYCDVSDNQKTVSYTYEELKILLQKSNSFDLD